MRNRILGIFITICILATTFVALPTFALEYYDGDLRYTVENNQATITGGWRLNREIVDIPSVIGPNSYTVVAIKDSAFSLNGCTKKFTIPDTVVSIGEDAFYSCSVLEEVKISKSVKNIGEGAFRGNKKLKSIIVDKENPYFSVNDNWLMTKDKSKAMAYCGEISGVYTMPDYIKEIGGGAFYSNEALTGINLPSGLITIGNSAFGYCPNLKEITIPSGVKKIGEYAFTSCGALKKVNMGNGVEEIGERAFCDCSALTDLKLSDSLIKMGIGAFERCTDLTSVTIPSGMKNFEGNPFNECSSLTSFNVETGNQYFSVIDGVLFNKNKTTLISYPGGKSGEYTIPNGVTEIGNSAFYRCDGLRGINFPASLVKIGDYAFEECKNIYEIDLPVGVQRIGNNAFSWCYGLYDVKLPKGLKAIGDYAFMYCEDISEIDIPSGVTTLGADVFYGCSNLTEVNLSETVRQIDSHRTFFNCTSLEDINVDINNPYLSSVDGVLFNKDKTQIVRYPLGRAGDYDIPVTVNSMADYAFGGSIYLTGVSIPRAVKKISDNAFWCCYDLRKVTLSKRVEEISYRSFYYCYDLRNYGTVYYEGSASDWSKIKIDVGNDELINSYIDYYNEIPVTNAEFTSMKYENNRLKATIEYEYDLPRNSKVMVVLYDKKGSLVKFKTYTIDSDQKEIEVNEEIKNLSGTYKVKTYFMDNTIVLKPLETPITDSITIN